MAERIVYLSWPAREITGGIKMAFRHVEALCANGLDATVATADALPPPWFTTTAPVVPLDALTPADVLVFPENLHDLLQSFAPWPNRKVVFCQNQFMLWRGLGNRRSYADFGVTQLLCPGLTAAAFCRRRFPDLPVHVVPYPLDPKTFAAPAAKRLQIAYMPRKRPNEARVVRDLFRAEHPSLADVPWLEIAKRSEAEVARVLGESAVYLSLARFESVGLSTLEALACGCVVAGFTGQGGRDYATAQNGLWADEDDCVGCAEQLGRAVQLAHGGGPLYRYLVEQAVATAAAYAPARFAEALLRYWRAFLAKGRPAT